MPWKSIDDIEVSGKTVLTRVDINVPMENGKVTDPTRIDRIVPTICDILAKGGKPVLLAHFGRPKGQVNPSLSLEVLVPELSERLGVPVKFSPSCIGASAQQAVRDLQAGEVLLLENTRFHAEETANDPEFSAELAALGEVYVNDAFSAAHRAHASTEGIARLLPSAAGRLMEAELSALERALETPQRPVGAVVGGAKVSTKIELLSNLVKKLDVLIIGGGMANTFLMAQGASLGASLVEGDMLQTAKEILEEAKSTGCDILLPTDGLVATEFRGGAPYRVADLSNETCLTENEMVLDAGPATVAAISDALANLRTLVWNGPLGAFEIEPFDLATSATAKRAAELTKLGKLISVAGGGDTVAALKHAKVSDEFTYLSTAGGAFLEWMEGQVLPGVAALSA